MRDRKRIGQAAAIVAVVLLCVVYVSFKKESDEAGGYERYSVTFFDVFDTQTEIIGYGTSQEKFEEQAQLLKEELVFYHEQYDIYNDYEGINNIKTINDNAGIVPVQVDESIVQLLKLSCEMYEKTDGQINIAMGSVLSIWHEYRTQGINEPKKAALPEQEELTAAAGHIDIGKVIIDEAASTVYLEDSEMSLDVGSIGKGYAVQQAAEYARELGMENVLISVGGNICAVGARTGEAGWRVGIQNPDLNSEEAYVEKVELRDASFVTSGSYQRYYVVDGVKYCHIIDPDTLMPADYFDSVSIIAADSGVADALSTSVYNMSLEEGLRFVNSMEDVEAMWILKDGSIQYSEHFEQYMLE